MRGKIKIIQRFLKYRGEDWVKIFLIYTVHLTARWCSWCTVDHIRSLYKVEINEFNPLTVPAIQTVDTLSIILRVRKGCVVLCRLNWEFTRNIILWVTQTQSTKINKIMLFVSPSGFSYQVRNIRIEKEIFHPNGTWTRTASFTALHQDLNTNFKKRESKT